MNKKVCKTCGSDAVWQKYWHNVNTGDVETPCDGEYWCDACCDYTEICDEDEYTAHKEH